MAATVGRRGSDSSTNSVSVSPAAPVSKYKQEKGCCCKLGALFARLCGNSSEPKEPPSGFSPRGSIVGSLPHFNDPLNQRGVPNYGSAARIDTSVTRGSESNLPLGVGAPPTSLADPNSAAEHSITVASSAPGNFLQVPSSGPQPTNSGRGVERSMVSSTSRNAISSNLQAPPNSMADPHPTEVSQAEQPEPSTLEDVDLDTSPRAEQSPNASLPAAPKAASEIEHDNLPPMPDHLMPRQPSSRRSITESQIP